MPAVVLFAGERTDLAERSAVVVDAEGRKIRRCMDDWTCWSVVATAEVESEATQSERGETTAVDCSSDGW